MPSSSVASTSLHNAGAMEIIMSDFLNASIEFVVVAFVLLMALDFISGLLRLYRSNALAKTEPQTKPELQPESAIATPTAPEPQQNLATLSWLEASIAPHAEDMEAPNVIDLAKRRQPRVPLVINQPEMVDYSRWNRDQLRRECSAQTIKWRDAHGKNKHLTKDEMIQALTALDRLTA